ncbi:MAG: HPF/RaiA family ribosome-associated protein [Betaproteobacteria bacterium]|nr:MAG: HPF/RaiA family ribosome-associated protein [Betaproteobacteria bacterium]
MQVPLQVTYHDMERSDALDARIRDKAAKLEAFHPHVTSCRVVVEERHRHHHQGKQFTVSIDVRVPGHELVVNRDHHEDVYVAVRDAFDAAGRKLEDLVRLQRGEIKAHELPQRGRVVRIYREEGYGFIETGDGRELYFGRDNVVEPSFEQLVAGTRVQFIEELAGEGRQAKRVSVGKHG